MSLYADCCYLKSFHLLFSWVLLCPDIVWQDVDAFALGGGCVLSGGQLGLWVGS